jgi:DNA-binding NtrC family response regulator
VECHRRLSEQEAKDWYLSFFDGDPLWRKLRSTIESIGDMDAAVLILGENAFDKDLVARAVHAVSRRSQGPFVRVNCAAIPQEMFDFELFGGRPGAHSLNLSPFEQAQNRTIYLDEIAKLSIALQATLLHRMETSGFARAGLLDIDTRVIAASNPDLRKAIERGEFREDLYYRFNTAEIHVPTMSERRSSAVRLLDVSYEALGSSWILRPPRRDP